MDRAEWLKTLKIGDQFAYAAGFGYKTFYIDTITEETKTRWKAGTSEYTKETGERYPRTRDRFSSLPCMQEVTPEIREKIKRQSLLSNIPSIRWDKLKTETLQLIYNIAQKDPQAGGK